MNTHCCASALDPVHQKWQIILCVKSDPKLFTSGMVHCFECSYFIQQIEFVLFCSLLIGRQMSGSVGALSMPVAVIEQIFFFPLALFEIFVCLTLYWLCSHRKAVLEEEWLFEEDTDVYWRGPISQGFVLQSWWDRCWCGHSSFSPRRGIVLETGCGNTAEWCCSTLMWMNCITLVLVDHI